MQEPGAPLLTTEPEPAAGRPVRVFISYAYEKDGEYQNRVKEFARRLRAGGVEAQLDAWHMDTTIPSFMDREVRKADRIVFLCSPAYRHAIVTMFFTAERFAITTPIAYPDCQLENEVRKIFGAHSAPVAGPKPAFGMM